MLVPYQEVKYTGPLKLQQLLSDASHFGMIQMQMLGSVGRPFEILQKIAISNQVV